MTQKPKPAERSGAPETPRFRIGIVQSEGDLQAALAIREIVFIEEQQVPEGIERDDEDATAFHLLCFDGGHAVGTGRLIKAPEPGWGWIGRMAVLSACRHQQVGSLLLEALESEARRRGDVGVVLHAQLTVRGFYARHGYREEGAPFEEAGMPHITVRKRFGALSIGAD